VWCVILGALLLLLLWKDVWLSEEMGGLARLDIEGLMTSKTRNWELPRLYAPGLVAHSNTIPNLDVVAISIGTGSHLWQSVLWAIQQAPCEPKANHMLLVTIWRREHSQASSLSPMSRYMGRVNRQEAKSPNPPPCRFSWHFKG
jgi:hypothetical protein